MDYGALTLIPIVFIIVTAILTKKSFESLMAGSVIACMIMHGTGFFLPWVDMLLETLSDPENQWVILVCGLFGSLIAMLRESRGTSGFIRIGEKLCRSERSALLGTFILGAVIFVDDYLNMLTVGTCMRPICDRRKVPREALAYLLDSTGTPICVLLPFSKCIFPRGSPCISRRSPISFMQLSLSSWSFCSQWDGCPGSDP